MQNPNIKNQLNMLGMPALSPEHLVTNKTQGGSLLKTGDRLGAEAARYGSGLGTSRGTDVSGDGWHLNHGLEGANVIRIFAAGKGGRGQPHEAQAGLLSP